MANVICLFLLQVILVSVLSDQAVLAQSSEATPSSKSSSLVQPPVVEQLDTKLAPPDNKPTLQENAGSLVNLPSSNVRYRVEMRLSGSNCLACLKELERKIRTLGVDTVDIQYPGGNAFEAYATPGLDWALATIVYDPVRISLAQIKDFLKEAGFHPFWISEKRLVKHVR